jgi:hypothetical protein
LCACLSFTLASCSLAIDELSKALEAEPEAYAGFTTKTKEGGGYKIVVENMRRGAITSTIRIDKDTRTYDVVLFDVEVSNIGQQQLSAFGSQFKLITDEGTVVESESMFKGGFEGDYSENKSSTLYPGTKKSGTIAFALKKTSNPKKLLFEPFYSNVLDFDLP